MGYKYEVGPADRAFQVTTTYIDSTDTPVPGDNGCVEFTVIPFGTAQDGRDAIQIYAGGDGDSLYISRALVDPLIDAMRQASTAPAEVPA